MVWNTGHHGIARAPSSGIPDFGRPAGPTDAGLARPGSQCAAALSRWELGAGPGLGRTPPLPSSPSRAEPSRVESSRVKSSETHPYSAEDPCLIVAVGGTSTHQQSRVESQDSWRIKSLHVACFIFLSRIPGTGRHSCCFSLRNKFRNVSSFSWGPSDNVKTVECFNAHLKKENKISFHLRARPVVIG